MLEIQIEDQSVFLVLPGALLQFWVQGVQPSLTALLSNPAREMGGYDASFTSTKLGNPKPDNLIFLFGPRSLCEVWIQDLLPPM